jgi:hypothetical protein
VESSSPARVLVVAHKTAATPTLIEAVRERAARGPADVHPPGAQPGARPAPRDGPRGPGPNEGEQILELALPLLEQAAGARVEGMVGVASALDAVQDALNLHGFDEVILSTLPARVSRWLHLDLPRKIAACGVPVTVVTPQGSGSPAPAA